MAGSFFHLFLANQAFSRLFGSPSDREIHSAFLAGSIAPDLGFFPGGPRAYSHQLHHNATGDHLRVLFHEADGEPEKAFAAGWALHLYTDVLLHPWVNARVEAIVEGVEGTMAARVDMWHLRIENGLDCVFLERQDAGFLWAADLRWHRSGGAHLLAAAGERFFGGEAGEVGLRKGLASQRFWIAWLPRIFLLTGHARGSARSSLLNAVGSCLRPFSRKVAGDWLAKLLRWDDLGAVGQPIIPDEETVAEAALLGERAVQNFLDGFDTEFGSFENLDLDTGKLIT